MGRRVTISIREAFGKEWDDKVSNAPRKKKKKLKKELIILAEKAITNARMAFSEKKQSWEEETN